MLEVRFDYRFVVRERGGFLVGEVTNMAIFGWRRSVFVSNQPLATVSFPRNAPEPRRSLNYVATRGLRAVSTREMASRMRGNNALIEARLTPSEPVQKYAPAKTRASVL